MSAWREVQNGSARLREVGVVGYEVTQAMRASRFLSWRKCVRLIYWWVRALREAGDWRLVRFRLALGSWDVKVSDLEEVSSGKAMESIAVIDPISAGSRDFDRGLVLPGQTTSDRGKGCEVEVPVA